jgi:hypothetical protein
VVEKLLRNYGKLRNVNFSEGCLAKKLSGSQRELRLVSVYSERSKTERGSEGPGPALLAGPHTDIWLER